MSVNFVYIKTETSGQTLMKFSELTGYRMGISFWAHNLYVIFWILDSDDHRFWPDFGLLTERLTKLWMDFNEIFWVSKLVTTEMRHQWKLYRSVSKLWI